MPAPAPRPYVKLSYTLVLLGMALLALERFGLSNMGTTPAGGRHIDGTILSLMVLVPVGLIAAGCIVFMVGKMRRL